MSSTAISVRDLDKVYRIGERTRGYRTLRENLKIRGRGRKRSDTHRALHAVSFDVPEGQVLGVIGANGAGKSTLLKILSRITEPTSGRAVTRGRVGSLLEVGTGFHPELTGRENVFLNGSILGIPRRQITMRLDSICEFADVGRFLDTPVKRYSTGMRLRLAFSVAAHLEPEILLIDEVLAVGDAEFQARCTRKMSDLARSGRTILFVSHAMNAVSTLCDRVLLLERGEIEADGGADEVISRYLVRANAEGAVDFSDAGLTEGTGLITIDRVRLLDGNGEVSGSVPMGGSLQVEIGFTCREFVRNPAFKVGLRTLTGQGLMEWHSGETSGPLPQARSGGRLRMIAGPINLLPGIYTLTFAAMGPYNELYDVRRSVLNLEILPMRVYPTGRLPSSRRAVAYTSCKWEAEFR